jgi:pimeloyl-ACP methyl ester carboxylesterase
VGALLSALLARLGGIAIAILVATPPAAAQTSVVQDIPAPGGGSERVLYASPTNPRAILVMFAGGPGNVEIDDSGRIGRMAGNFLMRTEPLWLAQSFAFVTIGSSSSLMGQRHTPAYAASIAGAIDFARTRANAPVWLVGTSQGSIAAANGAAHLPGRVAGVVLTSSVASRSSSGETVFDSNLGAIAVPALVVVNRGDGCASAGPAPAPQMLAALAGSPRKEIISVESHDIRSDPCEAMSPHGYLGIEADVVQRISDWIRAVPVR